MSAASSGAPALAVRGLTKRFGALTAADAIEVAFRRGEVHAVLGENGAGKSTLMKMLYGYYHPDEGTIEMDGVPVVLDTPATARARGIGMVFQSFQLVPALTVVENIALTERHRGLTFDRRALRLRLHDLSTRYGLDADPDARIRDLSVGERQRVEILKLLASDSAILILDEPTSVLAQHEVAALLDVLQRLRDDGYAVILITHKMREVMAIADRVTVLRQGRVVGSATREALDEHVLIGQMLGERAALAESPLDAMPRHDAAPGIEFQGITTAARDGHIALQDVYLDAPCGRITGIAAVAGNGQAELADVALGLAHVETGFVRLGGVNVTRQPTVQRLHGGLGVIPEDPLAFGAVPEMSVEENLLLNVRSQVRTASLLVSPRSMRASAEEMAANAPFALPAGARNIAALSGGNVQRVVLARELGDAATRYLLAYYPSRGLDIGSTRAVQQLLTAAASRGLAVLLVSEDLDELLLLADEIAVMHGGRIVGQFPRGAADAVRIGRLMTGLDAA